MEDFVTPAEYAAHMGVHLETVRRLLRAKKIPFVKVGRQYRIPRTALQAPPPAE